MDNRAVTNLTLSFFGFDSFVLLLGIKWEFNALVLAGTTSHHGATTEERREEDPRPMLPVF